MRTAHVISDEAFEEALTEIAAGNYFVAYSPYQYLLDKGDMYFFQSEYMAKEFATDNTSDLDSFRVFKASSIVDIYEHFLIEQTLAERQIILSNLKHTIMEDKNVEYLEKQLKFTGFGEGLAEQLKAKMTSGAPAFVLSHESKYGKDEVMAALQFRKSDNSEMYFFNRYNLMLKNDQYPDPVKQTFYINNGQDNITLKEAYNMMSGRAVHKELENKEGEKYKAWVQLDFKESDTHGNYKTKSFNENYGFKLDEVLGKHPIKELQSPEEKQKLMESLQRGNRQMVTLEASGQSVKIYIEAAPQYKSLNYYDSHGKRMQVHEVTNAVKQTNGEEQKQDGAKASAKQAPGDDVEGAAKQRKTKRQTV
jgi:hypothetical protein